MKTVTGAKSIEYNIVQCIIPKGSKYYEGTFGGYEGYASNKIKYVKLVE